MEKKKIKADYKFFTRYLNTMALVFVIIALSVLVYFLYNNFYLTLSEAKQVNTLQQKVLSDKPQVHKFQQILDNINKKTGNEPASSTENNISAPSQASAPITASSSPFSSSSESSSPTSSPVSAPVLP